MKKTDKEFQNLLDAIEREACLKSFYQFLLSFWDVISTEKLVANWHIEKICDELQIIAERAKNRDEKLYDLIVNIPPGSSKSSIIIYLFPVYCWIIDPTLSIISTSHSNKLSIKGGLKSRDIIISDKFKRLFPNVQIRSDNSAKTTFENTKGGFRYITSKASSILGSHAHIKLVDDLQDSRNCLSESDIEAMKAHMQTLFTREIEKGKSVNIMIMQRLSEKDATQYLLDMESPQHPIKLICLPAEESDRISPVEWRRYYKDGLFDPIRMSREVLEQKKVELGSRGYSAQFEQSPISAGGNLVKLDWFTTVTREYSIASVHTYNTFIDTAYKEANKSGEPKNDPSGYITCYFENNTLYISDYQEVWMSIMDLCRYLDKDLRKLHSRNSFLYVEPRASGVSIVQAMRELSNLNVCEIKGRKESKLVELNSILPLLESGRVVLVEGAWNDLFIKRLSEFPYGSHDEAVDVLCYALNYYIKNDTSVQEAKMKANIRKML